MIGYHYTTWDAYQKILDVGIKLAPLSKRHDDIYRVVAETIPNGCIWVYLREMTDLELVGQIFYVAVHHSNSRIVCLEVEYPEDGSAYVQWKKGNPPEDDILFQHTLSGVSVFDHVSKKFDLVTKPIVLEATKLVGSWDLLDTVKTSELVA